MPSFERKIKHEENGAMVYPKFRWFVMVTMIIGVMAQGVIMIAPAPLIGEVAKYLCCDLGLVTFTVMGLWTVTVCIGGVIGGAVVDRIGIVKVYLVCSVLLILSTVLIPLVGSSLPIIIALRLIGGLGTGPIITTISRLAAEWFPLKERGLITGVQGMSTARSIRRLWGLTRCFCRHPILADDHGLDGRSGDHFFSFDDNNGFWSEGAGIDCRGT